MLRRLTRINTNRGILPIFKIMPGYKIDTPDGLRPVRRVMNKGTSKTLYKGIKIVTYDKRVVRCDMDQYFFTRDASPIKAVSIKKNEWLKAKGTQVRVEKIIMVYDRVLNYNDLEPSSFGCKYYLANGILTAYRL